MQQQLLVTYERVLRKPVLEVLRQQMPHICRLLFDVSRLVKVFMEPVSKVHIVPYHSIVLRKEKKEEQKTPAVGEV